MTIAGTSSKEHTKQVAIEITIRAPKNFKGVKPDKVKGRNPTITDIALITMPLPDVWMVVFMASACDCPKRRSSLNRHKRWMV